MELGYDRPLLILPFDQRSAFEKGPLGFKAPLSQEQTAMIIASEQAIYGSLKRALRNGAPFAARAG